MTESEDVWKSRAETKMRGLFGTQRIIEDETSFEKNLGFGLDLTFIKLNSELERWELYGAGIDKFKRALAEDEKQTITALSQRLLSTVTGQIATLNVWKDRAQKAGYMDHQEECNLSIFELALFKVLWNSGQEVDIALRGVEEPGFDHSQDLVIKLQKPQV